MAEPIKIPPRPPALGANQLQGAAYARGEYFAIVSNETTFETVMTPGYWQNHIKLLAAKPFPRIEVLRQDGTMDLTLRCIHTAPGMAVMRVIHKFVSDENIGKPAAGAPVAGDESLTFPDGYKCAFVPNSGWLVRLANGEVLTSKLPSKKAAYDAAVKHAAVASVPAT